MPPAVSVQNVWKEYVVGQSVERSATFYDILSNALTAPFRKRSETDADPSKFWALKDVSFDVMPGEVVGIIGRNGAGKSTLLKVLSRITAPTRGRVEVRGRLASLLEVGTGFHGELSGRENIFLNGAILGMTRRDIAKKFDEIVAFAEVDKFIDTPVKRYSSGMYVRLAFAVAAHLECDVLVVDEVLAVGDTAFQEKCLGKMKDVAGEGRTVLFVSHDLTAVGTLCRRGLLLNSGAVTANDEIGRVLSAYATELLTSVNNASDTTGPLSEKVSFHRFTLNGGGDPLRFSVNPSDELVFSFELELATEFDELVVQASIKSAGVELLCMNDNVESSQPRDRGVYQVAFKLPRFFLRPGTYGFDVGAYIPNTHHWVWRKQSLVFVINSMSAGAYDPNNMGLVHTGIRGTTTPLLRDPASPSVC